MFNLKQMAASLAYLQDNGLTDYEQLEQRATAATERFHKLSDQIKSTEGPPYQHGIEGGNGAVCQDPACL